MGSREIERYGIYFANLDPARRREIAKTRPVIVVGRDEMNRLLDTVVVCPLTTKLHPLQYLRNSFNPSVSEMAALNQFHRTFPGVHDKWWIGTKR